MFFPFNYISGNSLAQNREARIEIFKTDITDKRHAQVLVDEIQQAFPGYKANFDLWDCDNILRIKSTTIIIDPSALINFLENYGCEASLIE